MPRRAPILLAVPLLALAACGGNGSAGGGPRTPGAGAHPGAATPAPAAGSVTRAGRVPAADVAVIRGWADALRRGHVGAASHYFALPSIVANGGGPIRLATRADVVYFNATLPCGARLLRVQRARGGYELATFVLTNRPGGVSCGSGAGATAQTAFRLSHGQITEWRRVATAADTGTSTES